MTEAWQLLILVVPVLVWVMAGIRSRRSRSRKRLPSPELVTVKEMNQMIRELSPELRPSARVTLPSSSFDSSHVWDSPTGKRVYMN
ncbi:MAG: hypothetical protein WC314_22290 [Vulcanimicrobiota bacterium]